MLKGIQITDNRKDQVRYSQTLSIPIFESIKPHNTPEKVLHFTANQLLITMYEKWENPSTKLARS